MSFSMFYKILRSCWDPVKNCWPSWRNALHQYDFLTERYRTLLCTSFVKINTAWNSILHMGLKVLIYLQILLHINSWNHMNCTWGVFPFLLKWSVIKSVLISDQPQASRCLFRRRTFSFLFLLPCFFQGFPSAASDPAFPGPTGPLPGL